MKLPTIAGYMKKTLLAVLLMASFHASADPIRFMFLESLSCGKYLALDTAKKDEKKFWFLGYLSGQNVFSDVDFLIGTDSDAVLGAVEKYCRENPLDYFSQAAIFVRNQLQKRARK